MACKNPECERNRWPEADLLEGTAQMLEAEAASVPACGGCRQRAIAAWLRELQRLRCLVCKTSKESRK